MMRRVAASTPPMTPPTTPPIKIVRFPELWSEVLLTGSAVEKGVKEGVLDPSATVAVTVTRWPLLMLDVAITSTTVLLPETIEVVEPEIALLKVDVGLEILDNEEDVFGVVAGVREEVDVGEEVGDSTWVITFVVVTAVVIGEGEGEATMSVPGESS
jgi:hypothetical protein